MSHGTLSKLNEVIGGNWSYRSERNIFESDLLHRSVANDVSTCLSESHGITANVNDPPPRRTDDKVTLSISGDADLSALYKMQPRPNLVDHYTKLSGIADSPELY
ncbi:MAG: hypothetical protein J0M34_09440 [Alphaproteobacteria bacterium]|nr:hypothetical protein [Alphaproteobacteria bacterium]